MEQQQYDEKTNDTENTHKKKKTEKPPKTLTTP